MPPAVFLLSFPGDPRSSQELPGDDTKLNGTRAHQGTPGESQGIPRKPKRSLREALRNPEESLRIPQEPQRAPEVQALDQHSKVLDYDKWGLGGTKKKKISERGRETSRVYMYKFM